MMFPVEISSPIGGGLFLLAKSTHEIHSSLVAADHSEIQVTTARFIPVIFQIAILNIVFSLNSVTTAVGLVDIISIMVIAIPVSMAVMLFLSQTHRAVRRPPLSKCLRSYFL